MPKDNSLFARIMRDKGSDKKDTVNRPLAEYVITEEDTKDVEFYSSGVVALNLLFSGRVDGAIPRGKMSMISAPSMLGKSIVSMAITRGAQNKNPDLNIVVMDTEGAFDFEVAKNVGINTESENLVVYHENSIEEVKTIILKTVDVIPMEERKNTIIILDSWGTLVSSKSVSDGLEGKDVRDMTLAQKKNELANLLIHTRCTVFVVNHVYTNIGGFGDLMAVGGGLKGIFNSSCIVLAMSRKKVKGEEDNILGHIITAMTYKSRYSKEKTVLEFMLRYAGGLSTWYGLLEDAIAGGYVLKASDVAEKEESKNGKKKKSEQLAEVKKRKKQGYVRKHIPNDPPLREDNLYTDEFWVPIFKDTDFKKYLEDKYQFRQKFDISQQTPEVRSIVG